MHLRAALAFAAVFALICIAAACASAAPTRLTIDVWPHGRTDARGHRHYSLSCHPAVGTVPRPASACAVLDRLHNPFAPTPPGTVCPLIILGPAEAHVVGLVGGRRVDAWLNLVHCGPQRWGRVKAVVPEPTLTVAPPKP